MAFKDITKVLYDGKVKLDYKDKAHRYYVRERINWDLPESDAKAWGKVKYPKGTTTLIGDTLEKKGLMTWPMGMALQELFGFYNFNGNDGTRRIGFSKDKGTMWANGHTLSIDQETALPIIKSASENWQRRQKKGADIGTVVHDAIDHYINKLEFDIAEQYLWNMKESDYASEADREQALIDFEEDVKCANLAFDQFVDWWTTTSPTLYGSEDLLYSMKHNVCGTYDGDIGIQAKYHPVFQDQGQDIIRVTADWKTSNASASEAAAMPEGINYQYFVQSAIYEMIRREMGYPPADDLLIVSCRKDGGFTLLYASELGLTVGDCIAWAEAVILCYRLAEKTKTGLWDHFKASQPEGEPAKEGIVTSKEEF